jgi:hypothetical protein
MKPLKQGIRIDSNGTGNGTDIIDIETGERIENVYAVDIHFTRSEVRVSLTFKIPVEYTGPVTKSIVGPNYDGDPTL